MDSADATPQAPLRSSDWEPAKIAAAVISQHPGHLHAGILHQRGALHLAWENRLQNEWGLPASLWITPDAPEENLRSVAQWCRTIWRRFEQSRSFPYGLGFDATFADDGTIILGEQSSGLTCASLIAAIFEAAGVQLVNASTWPCRTEDDRCWLAYLQEKHPSLDFSRLESDIEHEFIRIRPEEVVGACMAPPADYDRACTLGIEVVHTFDRLLNEQIDASFDASILDDS